jgi:aldose sugar dehydrogenase
MFIKNIGLPFLALVLAAGCETQEGGATGQQAAGAEEAACRLISDGFGPAGTVSVGVEEIATGLEAPWGIGFLPDGSIMISERPGRLRIVREGRLSPDPVATLEVAPSSEGGLLGLALHPDFDSNRLFYLYYTVRKQGRPVNRVERWRLSEDARQASAELVIIDDIPAAQYHNGGRLRFGPDGMLYVGTGDAGTPQISQDVSSPAGKILRLTPDGDVPEDNPFPGQPAFVTGIRNTQGFDWWDDTTLIVTDHGPSGEMGRRGHDEVSVARAGDNLGWPNIYGCQTREGMVTPLLTWERAVPPGGAAIYRGEAIPEWRDSLIIGSLRSVHLHRVVLTSDNPPRLERHEVYFPEELGRLREVTVGPDNELYVTTSNCDGRGNCGSDKDKLLRVVPRS